MKKLFFTSLFLFPLIIPSFSNAEEMDMAAQMERAMELGSPSENHKIFEPLVGTFDAEVNMWMEPDASPDMANGTAEFQMIMDGRFLKQDFSGELSGLPFEGMGLMGYDNLLEDVVAIWVDNFTTGIMKSTGKYDVKKKTIKLDGHFSCPMTGEKERWYATEWKIVNNDKNIYSSYSKDDNGKKFKSMEIIYTRQK